MAIKIDASKIASPFSSKTEEEGAQLSEKLKTTKEKLDSQWGDFKSNTKEYGRTAVVAASVIIGVYVLMETILPDEDPGPEDEAQVNPASTQKSGIGKSLRNAIGSLAWTMAMGFAKQKLTNMFASGDTSEQPEAPPFESDGDIS